MTTSDEINDFLAQAQAVCDVAAPETWLNGSYRSDAEFRHACREMFPRALAIIREQQARIAELERSVKHET